MKVFRCEMCGSSELLKTEDLYACKNCGTKYTLENAKKLIIEVDESDKINNLRILAKQALNNEDYASANKYYEELRKVAPLDFEIYFYSYYTRLICVDESNIDDNIEQTKNLLENLGAMLKQQPEEQQWDLAKTYTKKLISLCGFFSGHALLILQSSNDIVDLEFRKYMRNRYDGESQHDYKKRYCAYRHFDLCQILLIWVEIIEEYFRDKQDKEKLAPLVKGTMQVGISFAMYSIYFSDIVDVQEIDSEKLKSFNYYISIIKKYDSEYQNPFINQNNFNYKKIETIKELSSKDIMKGYFWISSYDDIHVYDNTKNKMIPFGLWKAKVESNPQAYEVTNTQQSQEKSKKRDWLWGIALGLIFGVIYIACCT